MSRSSRVLRSWLPLLALLLVPSLFFPGALPGILVVSADDHLSVHHGWQEAPGGSVRHHQLSDPALQFKALRQRVLRSVEEGQVPLWNPDLHAGRPLLADMQSMVGSPVTWGRLVLDEDTAQDFGVWWVLVWTGLGTALLVRRLGAGPWGVGVAGAAAMTAPYTWVWLLHPHGATFAWVPWVLWATERKRSAVLALCVAGLVGGGHPETVAHGLLFSLGWALARSRDRRVVLGWVLGALLSSPLWLPFAELLTRSATLEAHGGNTLALGQLLDALVPNAHGHPAGEGYTGPGVWADGVLHPGLAVLVLAAFGARRPGRGRWLVLAWLGCLVLATTGLPGPMNHARLGGMGALWLAVAAGLALDRARALTGGVALAAVLATGWSGRPLDQGELPPELHDPAPAAWTQRLAALTGDGRVVGLGWALQPNTGALVGVRDLRGYDLPIPMSWERLARRLDRRLARPWYPIEALTPEVRNLLRFSGVRYVLSEDPLDSLEAVDVGEAPLGVYALAPEAPRAWLTTASREVSDPETALDLVARDAIAGRRPPVEGLPALGGEPSFTPLEVQDTSNRVGIDLVGRVTEPSLLVLADTWDPWWKVSVDRVDVPVLRVGGVFRGVLLEPGASRVEFRYAPVPWDVSMRLLGLGLLGLLLVGWRQR